MNKPLEDTDKMPFGKYSKLPYGPKLMQDVPASYFHYLWTAGMNQETENPVHQYIKKNLDALKTEHPDGIW